MPGIRTLHAGEIAGHDIAIGDGTAATAKCLIITRIEICHTGSVQNSNNDRVVKSPWWYLRLRDKYWIRFIHGVKRLTTIYFHAR